MCDAEGVGGAIAGLVAARLYGVGADWLKGFLPWQKHTETTDGPHGRLVDHADSLARKNRGNRGHDHDLRTTDSISTPAAEPLETIV